MSSESPVSQALDALGIAHSLHRHTRPLRSLEQAARERGLQPGQIVRSLLFRTEGGEFVLVLAAGPAKLDWRRLRRHLGVTRLTTATADEVRTVTGYAPGAVSPFGLARPLRVLADRGVLAHAQISLGAGIPDAGVLLARDDLLRHVQPELGDFVETGTG